MPEYPYDPHFARLATPVHHLLDPTKLFSCTTLTLWGHPIVQTPANMRFPAVLSRLLAFVAFFHFVSAAAVAPLLKHQIEELTRREDDAEQLLNRRQSSANSSGHTVVTGIQGTGTQVRLEIRQLEKNADQWNIYLLGMNRFMRSNQSEKLSYYQVAGKS